MSVIIDSFDKSINPLFLTVVVIVGQEPRAPDIFIIVPPYGMSGNSYRYIYAGGDWITMKISNNFLTIYFTEVKGT